MTMTNLFETTDEFLIQLPIERIARVTMQTDSYSKLRCIIELESGFKVEYKSTSSDETLKFAIRIMSMMGVLES